MDTKTLDDIIDFLEKQKGEPGVIATVSPDGKPHAATVYYAYDKKLNIYFATRLGSKKYKNLLEKPYITFLVSSEHPPQTLHVDGTISLITDEALQRTFFGEIFEKAMQANHVPPISQMMDSELGLIKITPSYARLGDFDIINDPQMFREANFLN